jgi:hypothetical protein
LEVVSQIEEQYQGKLNKILETSFQQGENKPLVHAGLHIVSPNAIESVSPIYTIVHLPSTEQAKRLVAKVKTEQERGDIDRHINQLIEVYLSIDEKRAKGQYGVCYLPSKDVFFYMGILPEIFTSKLFNAFKKKIFKNENQAFEYALSIGLVCLNTALSGEMVKDPEKVSLSVIPTSYDPEKESYIVAKELAIKKIRDMEPEQLKEKILRLLG